MKVLPYDFKFKLATTFYTAALFVAVGSTLHLLSALLWVDGNFLIGWLCLFAWGPTAFYVTQKFYRRRVRRHKILYPQTIHKSLNNIQKRLNEMQSEIDNIALQIEYGKIQ